MDYKERAESAEHNFGIEHDKVVLLEAENEGYRKDLPKYGKKIEKLSDENKALKEFIKSIKCQLDVMSAKL